MLGAFNVLPHIGIIMVKPGSDAVTVSAEAPEVVFSVGARRKGATACLAASVRGSPTQPAGDVLVVTAGV